MFAQALKLADASLISAFDFVKIVWASLIGYVFFAEVPQLRFWIGGALIVAGCALGMVATSRAAKATEAQTPAASS